MGVAHFKKKGTFSFETSFEYFRLFHSSLFSSSLPSAFSAPPLTNFSASSLEHSANTLPSRLRSEPLMMTMPPEMPFSWKKQLDHRFFFFVAKHSLWSETAYRPFRSWHRIVLFSSFLGFFSSRPMTHLLVRSKFHNLQLNQFCKLN